MDDILAFLVKNWELCALFLIILLITTGYEIWMGSRKNEEVLSAYEAVAKINRENALVLDLRSKEQFARGHIINAFSLPLAQLESSIKRLETYKNRPVILICTPGAEAIKAKTLLQASTFFTEIKLLNNGITGWQEAKLPLEKTA